MIDQDFSDRIRYSNPSHAPLLEQHGITSDDALYRVIRDEHADDEVRLAACRTLYNFGKQVDRRRAVPALMIAMRSRNPAIRRIAIFALELLSGKRANAQMLAFAMDTQEDAEFRAAIVNTFHPLHEAWAVDHLRALIFDESCPLPVRAEAVEQSSPLTLEEYVQLLAHPIADLRFWAAFRLESWQRYSDVDLLPAFEILDHVAAFDHVTTELFGWHVDREAFPALERVRFHPYRQFERDEEGELDEKGWHTWLVSPALEYLSFIKRYRTWQEDWRYSTEVQPPVDWQIDPAELREKLERAWKGISFDPQRCTRHTYTLEWVLDMEGCTVVGGLHRDAYSLVLTGSQSAVKQFARWFATLYADQTLYLYGWSGEGILLKPNMTEAELDTAEDQLYDD